MDHQLWIIKKLEWLSSAVEDFKFKIRFGNYTEGFKNNLQQEVDKKEIIIDYLRKELK